jgi:2-aminoadipate transaminase
MLWMMSSFFDHPILDTQSGQSLYRQVYVWIRGGIEKGIVVVGERIPPTRELAGLIGLNRTTVSAAYELLENEGLIKSMVGKGTYVSGRPARSEKGDSSSAAGIEISFQSSRPSKELFPLDAFRATCQEVLASPEAIDILQLGSPSGYPPLRRYLLEEAFKSGNATEDDDILITNGCQQALDLIQRVFIANDSDSVMIEDPVYAGVRKVFQRARVTGVPVHNEGIDLDSLERFLPRDRPKLLVVTPNFQNPTGVTMPLPSRLAVLRQANAFGMTVVENNIYGGLRYEGENLPTIKSLDESGSTLLLGSFSKIAFPGMRVGWIIGPRRLIARLAEAKQWCDLHTDQLSQAVLLRFAESGRLAGHHQQVFEAGLSRLEAVIGACGRFLPPGSTFTKPEGGMNIWVQLPDPLDASKLLPQALSRGVSYLPGSHFAVTRTAAHCLRLSFAGLEPSRIFAGLAILGRVFADGLEQDRHRSKFDSEPVVV